MDHLQRPTSFLTSQHKQLESHPFIPGGEDEGESGSTTARYAMRFSVNSEVLAKGLSALCEPSTLPEKISPSQLKIGRKSGHQNVLRTTSYSAVLRRIATTCFEFWNR